MSLKPAIDLLKQQELMFKNHVRVVQENLNEHLAKVDKFKAELNELTAKLNSTLEACETLEKLELSKKETKNDTNQNKKTERKSSVTKTSN